MTTSACYTTVKGHVIPCIPLLLLITVHQWSSAVPRVFMLLMHSAWNRVVWLGTPIIHSNMCNSRAAGFLIVLSKTADTCCHESIGPFSTIVALALGRSEVRQHTEKDSAKHPDTHPAQTYYGSPVFPPLLPENPCPSPGLVAVLSVFGLAS